MSHRSQIVFSISSVVFCSFCPDHLWCSRLTTQRHLTLSEIGAWSQTTAKWERVMSLSPLCWWCLDQQQGMEKLQNQLMELAIRNAELIQRVLAVEAVISTPTPQQSVATRLLKQPVAFDGDRNEMGRVDICVQSLCQSDAWSSRWSTRRGRQTGKTCPQRQVRNRSMHSSCFVSGMLVKDGTMKKARNTPVGHDNEIWRLLCEEYWVTSTTMIPSIIECDSESAVQGTFE